MKKRSGIVLSAVLCCITLLHAGGDKSGESTFGGKVDISDLNPAEVVQALFKIVVVRGRTPKQGFDSLSIEEARAQLIKNGCSLKTLKGCDIPIDITAGEKEGSRQIDTRPFNAWNGALVAERAIAELRKSKKQ